MAIVDATRELEPGQFLPDVEGFYTGWLGREVPS
jgi:acetone carboxylase gamma subunit